MKHAKKLARAALLCIALFSGCSKKSEETTPSTTTTQKDAFIQYDDKKNTPVTQKANPYNNASQKYSVFFATSTLDMTTKVGSNAAIVQILLTYSVPNKSNAEIDVLAKAMFDGIAEGKSIKVKILGDNSRIGGVTSGFILGGSASAGTGAWDSAYNLADDVDMDVSRVNGKIQFSVSTPIAVNMGKRGGAGNPNYPSFDATTMFCLQISL
jgi:hypothetical protein